MKILVLGGTIFLGRHFVTAALAAGHELTLFNRGKHNPGLFPEVEKLRGDRDGGLDALRGRRWDAALDTCGYVPRVVKDSTSLLKDAVERYTFVSSLSVYSDQKTRGQEETASLATLDDPGVEEVTGETYGALKALCETAAEAGLPGRVHVVRPGLIVGPFDPTDRFTYWPVRFQRGGDVLVPGPRDWEVEFTDVRDLAAFLLHAMESGHTGVDNASGPAEPRPRAAAFFDACARLAEPPARPVWADEAWLLAQGVEPWSQLPLWVGSGCPAHASRSSARGIRAGLRFRPIEETLRETLEWARRERGDREWAAGLAAGRERDLIERWQART